MSNTMKVILQICLLFVILITVYGIANSLSGAAAAFVLSLVMFYIPYIKEKESSLDNDGLLESGDISAEMDSKLPGRIKTFAYGMDQNIDKAYIGISDAADATIPLINQIAEIKKIAEHSNMTSSQVATAGHELAMTITEISETINESAGKAGSAVDMASCGVERIAENNAKGELVGETMNMLAGEISELESAAMRIGDVVQVINDLSDQTNLLALNAAIEAARAGEAGRGFAVVADEVRMLAKRTKSATEEIGGVVKGITTSIRKAAEMSSITSEAVTAQLETNTEVSSSFNEVADEMASINGLITNISSSIKQQVGASTQIAESIEDFRHDAELLDSLGDTLAASINGLMESITSIDQSVAPYKKGNKAAMFIRAKIAHANVLRAMQMAVINRQADMKIPDHENCMFGKAYYSSDYQEAFRSDTDFKAIEDPHKLAHKYADLVVAAVRNGDSDVHSKLRDFSNAIEDFKRVMNIMLKKLVS